MDSRWQAIDTHCAESILQPDTTAVSVAITDRDRLLKAGAWGWADRAANQPATAATAFRIGSIGKSFAAIVLLQLHEAGRLDVLAPLSHSLPWLDLPSTAPLTLHHVLSHTAGLPEDGAETRAAARELAADGPFSPRDGFSYSNAGYNLLGYLLEDLLGEPYGAIIQTRILDPLGMRATAPILGAIPPANLAVGYAPDETGALRQIGYQPCSLAEGCSAAPASDLALYAQMLLNNGRGPTGALLMPESFALLTSRVTPAWGGWYGYGLVSSELEGHRCVGHRGETGPFKSYLLANLDAGLAVIALVCGGAEPIDLGEFLLAEALKSTA